MAMNESDLLGGESRRGMDVHALEGDVLDADIVIPFHDIDLREDLLQGVEEPRQF